jgi:hypothetical protein
MLPEFSTTLEAARTNPYHIAPVFEGSRASLMILRQLPVKKQWVPTQRKKYARTGKQKPDFLSHLTAV